jgi:hypothetical protein
VISVVDRHCLDADPDPTIDSDADPDLDPKPTQPDPTLHMLVKSEFFKILLFAKVPAIEKII